MTFIFIFLWLMFGFAAESVVSKTNDEYGIKLGIIENIFTAILYSINGAIGFLLAMQYRKEIAKLYRGRFPE